MPTNSPDNICQPLRDAAVLSLAGVLTFGLLAARLPDLTSLYRQGLQLANSATTVTYVQIGNPARIAYLQRREQALRRRVAQLNPNNRQNPNPSRTASRY